jgi:hypothetical protein
MEWPNISRGEGVHVPLCCRYWSYRAGRQKSMNVEESGFQVFVLFGFHVKIASGTILGTVQVYFMMTAPLLT